MRRLLALAAACGLAACGGGHGVPGRHRSVAGSGPGDA